MIEIEPLGAAAGARLHGVDLSKPMGDNLFGEVRQALLDHLVIVLPNQDITPEQHKDFSRQFGTLNVHPHMEPLDGHPEILHIVKEPDDKLNFGGGWHSDLTFLPEPVLGSVLYAREVPATGGDTMWANAYMAYEGLTDKMKEVLGALKAVHTANEIYGADGIYADPRHPASDRAVAKDEAAAATEHPIVRTHPETGRKLIFVNPAFTTHIAGMSRKESKPILDFLFDQIGKPENVFRHKWSANDVVMWDNRCTQHYALNDYHGQRREMHRVTVDGDRPY